LPTTDTYSNTGDRPNAFDRRTIPAGRPLLRACGRFIGSKITDDVFCTRRVSRYSLKLFPRDFFQRGVFDERKREKREKEGRKSVSAISSVRERRMCRMRVISINHEIHLTISRRALWEITGISSSLLSPRCRAAESFRK